jgi:predicted RNA binding protein YcfA (HicA-like mRNA interferase family)
VVLFPEQKITCKKVNNYLPLCMKCSEALRILKKDGWYPISQKGSHIKLKHNTKKGTLIFPNHGSQELGKGLQKKLFKQAEIK